jgi:hypothetical protein
LKAFSFILPILLTLSAFAGGVNPEADDSMNSVSLEDFLEASGGLDISAAPFEALIAHFEKKKKSLRTEHDFVRHIFVKTHAQILKRYKDEAKFQQLFIDGTYNCLTGTILYSLILNHFNIRHEVIETNYHIFLIVQTNQGEVLIEVTDPLDGFVNSKKEIEERIEAFKNNVNTADVSGAYEFSFNLYNSVSQRELLGLLYYNLAVESFNKQQVDKSVVLLAKASELYYSTRIREFAGILLFTISQSDLDDQSKAIHTKELRNIRGKSAQIVAGI